MNDFYTALRFLTILPLPVPAGRTNLAGAMLYFPLVGFLIGVISLGLFALVEPFFPPRLSHLMLVLSPIILSGGLHIDGFTDFFDGFFQGRNREDRLRIMRDPRMGVWGALGLIALILIKWELVLALPFKEKSFLLALMLSRWSHVVLSYFLPPAREDGGLGHSVARRVSLWVFAGSTCFVGIAAGFCPLLGLFGVAGALLFLPAAGLAVWKRLGGITGDVLGALGEMCEVAVFLSIVILS